MTYLLDTCVISAQRRQQSKPSVCACLQEPSPDDLYISLITIGEIRAGIHQIRHKDPKQAAALETWFSDVRRFYSNKVLALSESIIECWGHLGNCRKQHPIDALVAATAIEYDITLVTRNTKHVADTGVKILNPWED